MQYKSTNEIYDVFCLLNMLQRVSVNNIQSTLVIWNSVRYPSLLKKSTYHIHFKTLPVITKESLEISEHI